MQRIEITDNRSQETMRMEFPSHYTFQVIAMLERYMPMLQRNFTLRFDPPADVGPNEPKKISFLSPLLIAALGVALEEGYI